MGMRPARGSVRRELFEVRSWRGLTEVPDDWGRSVVTFGIFDGVHRGHQSVLAQARERARELAAPIVVVTFDPHPDTVLHGTAQPAEPTPLRRKAGLLEQHGADAMCVVPFTRELVGLSAQEFVQSVLVDRLHATAVVLGADARFGYRAAGDIALLRTLGEKYEFDVDAVPLVKDENTGAITSTRIREHIRAGSVDRARAALGRPHWVEGLVVHGAARGRELLGFPTANVDCAPATAVPGDGVYAGRLVRTEVRAGAEPSWPAAISVGTNPTFHGAARSVEAYALDRDDLDLYGETLGVEFLNRIRPMERFDDTETLIEAMRRDVERARELMAGA